MSGKDVALALADLVAIALFIYGLHELNSPATARRGNRLAMVGMAIALVAILVQTSAIGWWAIAIGVALGGAVGIVAALKVKMTAMPQMVALYNGAGGGAAALISIVEYYVAQNGTAAIDQVIAVSLVLSLIIGSVSFAGSIIAFLKLQEVMTGRPVTYPGQQVVNAVILLGIVALAIWFVASLGTLPAWGFLALVAGAIALGVLFVLPIGGADMPVVISLLNSATGVAVAIAGFEINSVLLVICGALVGASGTILTVAMSKAMNRPLTNVLFGAFGATGGMEPATGSGGPQQIRQASADDVAIMLAYANKVVFVPGYGMAVAQAQHSVKALADQLEKRGVKVLYAIHPVAGRMPGHMNVLLAEANVPYNQLLDMDDVNPEFTTTDVALVIGANDVTNPAARNVASSPIYGMPILDVDKAQNVVVLKRSMRSGFAGIENPLYEMPNCSMLFGDAKASVDELTAAVKAS
ncbi:MAG: NAD(P)(+) transhydrogenase (Re/Si-specific) subunit beta [Candidatus Eremiobacteraeota bacterium]|nr:NAD(P)(+) transhydrogenase (Re/Si-specific) subunit beta [Candidatus Eremiobacteraeota bacterium]MBV8433527.1 NAD(P)(+) transhydrogenase (Re/Si-specific) subunit beta [Candidatus Eremiobacteraeota bacterium]